MSYAFLAFPHTRYPAIINFYLDLIHSLYIFNSFVNYLLTSLRFTSDFFSLLHSSYPAILSYSPATPFFHFHLRLVLLTFLLQLLHLLPDHLPLTCPTHLSHPCTRTGYPAIPSSHGPSILHLHLDLLPQPSSFNSYRVTLTVSCHSIPIALLPSFIFLPPLRSTLSQLPIFVLLSSYPSFFLSFFSSLPSAHSFLY